jgi:uncharacterized protein (UPF0332 family)
MGFEWSKYLELAEELAQRDDEAALRSAVSRAYYAVYGKARSHLQYKGIAISNAVNGHEAVWNAFKESGGRTSTGIGINGDRLRRQRNVTDYENVVKNLSNLAQGSIKLAKNVMSYLENLV